MKSKALKDLDVQIENLIKKGKAQGYITFDEIDRIFSKDEEYSIYLGEFLGRLEEENIEISDSAKLSQLIVEKETKEQQTNDPITIYLREIGQIPMLTADEEKNLAREMEIDSLKIKEIEAKVHQPFRKLKPLIQKWQENSIKKKDLPPPLNKLTTKDVDRIFKKLLSLEIKIEESKKKFIEANLRLVVNIAKRFPHDKLSMLDLINEGNLGLIHAISKFDYKEGYKFSTYAIWWIKQAIIRAISEYGRTIRIPVYMVELLNRCMRTINGLVQELGREPTLDEIADKMNLSVAKIIEIINISQEPTSLESPVGIKDESLLGELIEDKETLSPTKAVFLTSLQEEINEMLRGLNSKERTVIKLRYGLDGAEAHTLEEIGKVINMTREAVRLTEKKVLDKLRKTQIGKNLYDFLPE